MKKKETLVFICTHTYTGIGEKETHAYMFTDIHI